MSLRDYLHEKAEESRHNETLAYIVFLTGSVFFIGGVLETLSLPGIANWFLFIPYYAEAYPGSLLGLALVIGGICMVFFGIAAGINYSRDRGWYMHELRRATSTNKLVMNVKTSRTPARKKNHI